MTTANNPPSIGQVIEKMSHAEGDYDRLFIEELAFGNGFGDTFLSKLGLRPRPIKAIRHSVYENFGGMAHGETDVMVVLEDGAILLIENKLTAAFQPQQAARYRARAEHHASQGAVVRTVLIAPAAYLVGVPEEEWDLTCSYRDIADCILGNDPRSVWRNCLFRDAGNRAERLLGLAKNDSARRRASVEMLNFKAEWVKYIASNHEWVANPQSGANDEFLYAPKHNPWGLRIWHHPFAGYMSVQNLEKVERWDIAALQTALPERFSIKPHPKSLYLDTSVPAIDMTTDFQDEVHNVAEGMKVAGEAIKLIEEVFG